MGGGKPPWNRFTSWEVDNVQSAARELQEQSCRQLVASSRSLSGASAITSSKPISLRSVEFHSAWPCASFALHRRLITHGKSGAPLRLATRLCSYCVANVPDKQTFLSPY